MLYRYLILLFLIFPAIEVNPLSAQEMRYRSDLITRENGLSNSSVSCITRDNKGFLWFGTWNGLNRFDGYEMTVFQPDPNDSSSISNGNINTLFEDREGILWIATDNGLNAYNPVTSKFKRYYFHTNGLSGQRNNQINDVSQDKNGRIWVACQDGGLICLNKTNDSTVQYSNPFSVKSNTIHVIEPDNKDGRFIWLGTADGLFSFNCRNKGFERKASATGESALFVLDIIQDKEGNLFIGTWGNGLLKYDFSSSTLENCLSLNQDYELIRTSIIRAMSFDDKGNLIFNVRDKGLMSYNVISHKVSEFYAGQLNNDLNNKSVTSLYIDRTGIIWTGTIYDGVIKIVPLINSFKHYAPFSSKDPWNGGGVTSILEDAEGDLWLGTRFGGIYKFDRKQGGYTLIRADAKKKNSISSNNILALLEVTDGRKHIIWIGTDGGGLNRYDPSTGRFSVYKNNKNQNIGPASNSVSSILQYDEDHLLIGTRDRYFGEGLDVFNFRTGKFVNLRYDPSDSLSLGSNNIQKIFKDRTGIVWVGTRNGGLNKFVVKNMDADRPEEVGYFIRYTNNPSDPSSLSNNTVYSIHDDARHNLWIGTNDGGLSKFDPSTGAFSSSILYDYLKDHLIYGILTDNHDNLWLSTSRGIIALNLVTKEIHNFDKYDGLQETAFIYGSSYKSASGEMFFGGIKGCNSFHPDSIRLNLNVPEIVITSFTLSGKKGIKSITSLTGKSVQASKVFHTPYYQNNFSISFSALDFQMPARNRFKYMLDGYDQQWTETNAKRRYVSYTNLPPGKYIFRVIGSNSDDIWNHTGTTVTIYITPPFWNTMAFRAFIGFIMVCLLLLAGYLMKRKYHEQKQKAEQDALSSLQDERKQLRTLIDNIPDLVFIKDRECRFTLANIKVAQVMGTTPENLIGKTDFDFYDADLALVFYNDELRIMTTGEPMINCEETALDENGNRIIRSTTKVPVRNTEGEIIGIAGVCRDITKLKQIENQLRKKSEDLQEINTLLEGRQKEILRQSEELAEQTQHLRMANSELDRLNRTKDKFFSIIAHDLRNPFNAIIGFGELLRNDFYDMDNAQKLNVLELINVSSQTAYNLLENLLQWARTQTDKIDYNPENFDLSETADKVIDLHCIIARKKGVRMRNNIASSTLVHADKNMVSAVLRNLVSNAIKFSNPDGEIVLTVNRKDDHLEVNVSDDGVGMTRESLGKLFRIDTYYSTSGTMGESGTGLGLIICKEFIEKNKGRIRATSKEGSGTTMTFTLNPSKN